MNLIFEYPSWYVLLCLALALMYSLGLYYKNETLAEVERVKILLMGLFRFVGSFLLALFLLTPLLKTVFDEIEKPLVVIVTDNSSSIVARKDSASYMNLIKEQLTQFKQSVSDDYEVRVFGFSADVVESEDIKGSGKVTDISNAVKEVENKFANRNVGALIIASDGVYNQGTNPLYAATNIKFPVYTVGLGDTTRVKDVLVDKVSHNKMAYLGNKFPLDVIVKANDYKGGQVSVSITQGGKELFQKDIAIDSRSFIQHVEAQIEAKSVGVQRYLVSLTEMDGEVTLSNNKYAVYVDVLDDRQKVLILANSAHPDIAALRSAIGINENYQVDVVLSQDFKGGVSGYNLVVLHNLPSKSNFIKPWMNEISEKQIPVLFIIGEQASLATINGAGLGLQITGSRNKIDQAYASVNDNFPLFKISPELKSLIKVLPPLSVPFGNYKLAKAQQTLLFQRIGIVDTKKPVISLSKNTEHKIGIISGEGIWRWKLEDYRRNENNELFNDLIGKIIQYLNVKEDKSRFRVAAQRKFKESDAIVIDAELYNDNYELINDADINVKIKDQEGNEYPYSFSKTEDAYTVNAGTLPIGQYTFRAEVAVNGEVMVDDGAFAVMEIQLENSGLVADHRLLYKLASQHNGELIDLKALSTLGAKLKQRDDIKPIIYSQQSLEDLINLKWIFFLILSMFSLEWFMKKRNGAY